MTGEIPNLTLPTKEQLIEELLLYGCFDPDEVDAMALTFYELEEQDEAK